MLRRIMRVFLLSQLSFALCLAACGSTEAPAATATPSEQSGPCTEAECGARPPGPRGPCPDGVTIAGPSCARGEGGSCVWTLIECPGAGLPGAGLPGAEPGAAPEGRVCGGMMGAHCDASEYCHYTRDAICGAADQTGVCRPRPEACAQVVQPVCGCDGVTYSNECAANAAGFGVSSDGACAPIPPG